MSYEVVRPLGSGTSGEVFEVRDASGQRFALKRFEGLDATQRRRFERELGGLLRLRHPNIVAVHDAGLAPAPFLVMELIEGESLARRLAREGPLPLDEALSLFGRLAEALAAVHEAGLLHRDVKPENILIEAETGRPVLVDFGLVKAAFARDESVALTRTGAMVGTPSYMAPEQFDAEAYGRETPATDVWGWAATLMVALTGQPPFPDATLLTIAQRVTCQSPPRLRSRRGDIPAWLDELGAEALRREPDGRPTARELGIDLEARASRSAPALSIRALVGLASAAALILGAAAILLSEPPAELRRPEPAPGPVIVGSRGRRFRVATSPGVRVCFELGGEVTELTAGEDGLAAIELSAPRGPQRLRAVIPGSASAELSWELLPDVAPPAWAAGVDQPHAGFALVAELPGELRIRVEDASDVTVTFDEEVARADAEGWVSVSVSEADGLDPVTLIARDALGAETRWTGWLLVGRADDPALILQDRELWNRSAIDAQDAAIAEAGRRLRPAFGHLETAVYACGGARHRIATFRHTSGLHLNLLPGGPALIGLPEARFEAEEEACAAAHEALLTALEAKGQAGLLTTLKSARVTAATIAQEGPAVRVRLRPFLMGRVEAAWGPLRGAMADVPALAQVLTYLEKRGVALGGGEVPVDELPLTSALVEESAALCEKLGLRLPSEAEWEYACRAGTETRYTWGERYDARYCWSILNAAPNRHPNFVQPARFDPSRANAFGLCDTLGNVWEQVSDHWQSPSLRPRDGRPLLVPGSPREVRRGGGMLYGDGAYSRVTSRGTDGPSTARTNTKGFRVACDLPRE